MNEKRGFLAGMGIAVAFALGGLITAAISGDEKPAVPEAKDPAIEVYISMHREAVGPHPVPPVAKP